MARLYINPYMINPENFSSNYGPVVELVHIINDSTYVIKNSIIG